MAPWKTYPEQQWQAVRVRGRWGSSQKHKNEPYVVCKRCQANGAVSWLFTKHQKSNLECKLCGTPWAEQRKKEQHKKQHEKEQHKKEKDFDKGATADWPTPTEASKNPFSMISDGIVFKYLTARTTKDAAKAAKQESWKKTRESAIALLNSGEERSVDAAVAALSVLAEKEKEFELLPSSLVELAPLNAKALKDLHNEAHRIADLTTVAHAKSARLMAELQAQKARYNVLVAAAAQVARRIEEDSQLARTLKVEQQLEETVPANVMSNKLAAELQEVRAKRQAALRAEQDAKTQEARIMAAAALEVQAPAEDDGDITGDEKEDNNMDTHDGPAVPPEAGEHAGSGAGAPPQAPLVDPAVQQELEAMATNATRDAMLAINTYAPLPAQIKARVGPYTAGKGKGPGKAAGV